MSNSITIAHEIGHTMGVEHDVSPDCITHGYTVMSPTVAQRFKRHMIYIRFKPPRKIFGIFQQEKL